MTKLNTNSKKGFTIIEVVLVLAIAGLIFLMVFIALPNLQRTQRDTQRRNDVDRVSSSLVQYVANNNKLPTVNANQAAPEVIGANLVNEDGEVEEPENPGAWDKFYINYLLANGDDSFEDPNGGNYNLYAQRCVSTGCPEADPLNQDYEMPDGADTKYTVVISANAKCGNEDDDNIFQYTDGTRKFAVAMRLEGTGLYCVNN